jgi:hypothetical protein
MPAPAIAAPGDFLPSLVCRFFVQVFALWTIACNLTVFAGASLRVMIGVFAVLALAWTWVAVRCRSPADEASSAFPAGRNVDSAHIALLWAMVVLAVAATLMANRPDGDDSNYINRAVITADAPAAPAFVFERTQLEPELIVPIRRTTSIEMLGAALSHISGIPVIYWFHMVFAPLAAMMLILANAGLFRELAPRHWIWGVVGVVVFLVATGEFHRSFGNFSFVRLQQGKAILLSVMVPLLMTYSFRFLRNPRPGNWLLLAAAQIAAMGLSSTGLIIAPLIVALSLLAGALATKGSHLKIALIGSASALYPLTVAFGIRFRIVLTALQQAAGETPAPELQGAAEAGGWLWASPKYAVFGDGSMLAIHLAIILGAWMVCRNRLARWTGLVFAIAFLALVNRWVGPLLVDLLRIEHIGWRLYWVFPLPILAALVMIAPLTWSQRSVTPIRAGLSVLLAAGLLLVSQRTIFFPDPGLTLGKPGLKVRPEYAVAAHLDSTLPKPGRVLSPPSVSLWLPTFHRHHHVLMARIPPNKYRLPEQRQLIRVKLLLGGYKSPPRATGWLRDIVTSYGVDCVVVTMDNPKLEEIRNVLELAGFAGQYSLQGQEIWLKSD